MQRKDQPFTYKEFKEIYSKVPRVCIDLFIKTDDGLALGLRKNFGWENQWQPFGGTLFYNESIADAVKRLGRAEAGVDVEIVRFMGYTELPNNDAARGFGHDISLAFLCKIVGGTLKPDENSSEIKCFWKLPENVIKEHRSMMEHAIKSSVKVKVNF